MKPNPIPKIRSERFTKTTACKLVLKIILMFESLMQLNNSAALFAPYLLFYAVGLLAVVSLHEKERRFQGSTSLSKRERHLCNGGAILFAFLIVAANYPLWLELPLGDNTPAILRSAYGLMMLFVISSGCFFVFHSIFCFVSVFSTKITWQKATYHTKGICKPRNLFFLSFFVIAFVYLFVLFLIKYPGLVETDTINQFRECISGEYTNNNPLFSTLVIKPFVVAGMALFHDINACAALYFTAQAIFVAFAFACIIKTLAEMKVPAWFLLC